MEPSADKDVELIRQIPAVPSILDVIAKVTGMGFVTVARVTDDRWIACEVLDTIDFGLKPGGELQLNTTICSEERSQREPVVIENVAQDPIYFCHPGPKMYGFQSHISMPIILPDGSRFGTLCAVDRRPVKLSPEIIAMFKLFAELIAVHVVARKSVTTAASDLVDEKGKFAASQTDLAASETALLDARAISELREQFIAVLGHDLRNPLKAR